MPLATKAKESAAAEERALVKKVRKEYSEPVVRFEMKVSDKDGDDLHRVLTVEDPARTLFVSYAEDHSHVDRYRIAKPISYMNVHFNRFGHYVGAIVFFSHKRVRGSTSAAKIQYVPLPNVGYDFHHASVMGICMGHHIMHGQTLEEKALKYNEHFWNSKFNDQMEWDSKYDPFKISFRDYGFSPTLERWQKLTEKKKLPKFKAVRGSMGKSIRHAAEALRNALFMNL